MTTLDDALASHTPGEVAFSATVTTKPHVFFGANTHAFHESFDVRDDAGNRVEVIENLKFAPRLPVAPGDRIAVAGELVLDSRSGPLVHWTHHDPRGFHPDGYIDFNGRRYA